MERIIKTVSGHIGAGKSRYTRQWLAEQIAEHGIENFKAVIATPTNTLSDQHHERLTEAGIESMVVCQASEDRAGYRSASEQYDRLLKEDYAGVPEVNHFVALTTKTNTANRLLIVDEVFNPIETIKIQFEQPEDLNCFEVVEAPEAPEYYELVTNQNVVSMLTNVINGDEKFKTYSKAARELAEYIINVHYRVVIDKDSFDKAKSGEAFKEDESVLDSFGMVNSGVTVKSAKSKVFLQFTIFTLPTIIDCYKSTMILTANIKETFLYMMWSKDTVFKPHSYIESLLDYTDFSHNQNLFDLYNVPTKNLSKSFLKQLSSTEKLEEGTQIFLDIVAPVIADMFANRPHIYCTNKHPTEGKKYHWALDDEDHGGTGKRVITNPHGWNDLQHYDMGVFLAAINYDPETLRRLHAFYGITSEQAKKALCYQIVYQFLGRTAMRNKDSKERVALIVPDEGCAEYVQKLLGCAPSTPLPINFAKRPRKVRKDHKTAEERRAFDRERQAAYRARKKAAVAAEIRA